MRESLLRSYIREILESSDRGENKSIDDLLLEPMPAKKERKKESSSVGGGSLAGGLLAEPDSAASDGVTDSIGNSGEIDSGDGCSEIEDCEKENEKEVDEGSGAGAIAGAIVPLGAGPSYPAPDRRSPSAGRHDTARAIGRAFGGASPARKK